MQNTKINLEQLKQYVIGILNIAIHSEVLITSYRNLYHEPTLTRYKAVQHTLVKPAIHTT